MRVRASFQRRSDTEDGYGERVDTWTETVSRRVRIEPVSASETDPASGETARIYVNVFVRYDSATAAIRPYDRMVADGITYEVEPGINIHQLNRELKFRCFYDAAA